MASPARRVSGMLGNRPAAGSRAWPRTSGGGWPSWGGGAGGRGRPPGGPGGRSRAVRSEPGAPRQPGGCHPAGADR